ncbi:hypothetical protein [Embleya sp. MST-111070]
MGKGRAYGCGLLTIAPYGRRSRHRRPALRRTTGAERGVLPA